MSPRAFDHKGRVVNDHWFDRSFAARWRRRMWLKRIGVAAIISAGALLFAAVFQSKVDEERECREHREIVGRLCSTADDYLGCRQRLVDARGLPTLCFETEGRRVLQTYPLILSR